MSEQNNCSCDRAIEPDEDKSDFHKLEFNFPDFPSRNKKVWKIHKTFNSY
jgi:hypothetical protein